MSASFLFRGCRRRPRPHAASVQPAGTVVTDRWMLLGILLSEESRSAPSIGASAAARVQAGHCGPFSVTGMTTAIPPLTQQVAQDLVGQTVVVIGGSSGIGLETARLARAHGAEVI